MFTLRFDMRAPAFGAPIGELYAAGVEMCAWAEDRGALVAVLSEHHGTEDRHLPSPIVLASAIVARLPHQPSGDRLPARRRAIDWSRSCV